ncbi:MAG: hypothetical protein GC159_01780 [Phycisphaera sp.]|nr:hypothetical protein [Phycisphaera sp.]
MMILCPYCGQIQQQADQCVACKGIFEPLSRCASQISMGPWYMVMPKRPFMPGFSYDVLKDMVKRGRIKADTPVRGPGTNQLWAYAARAPGVAHLLGKCYACDMDITPGQPACPGCKTSFPTEFDRNKLGLAAGSLAQAVRAQLERNVDLCPTCGMKIADHNRCGSCGVVFNPPDMATRITLGAWSLRYSSRPFYISSSYQEIKDRIEVGGIKPDTILRGPTTYQFWSMAQTVPGIAHLLGYCQSCRKQITPKLTVCPHCSAHLDVTVPQDELGLLFPTQESVVEAQRQLDEAVAQLEEARRGGEEPAQQVPDGIEADFLPLAVDDTASAAPAGEGMFSNQPAATPAAAPVAMPVGTSERSTDAFAMYADQPVGDTMFGDAGSPAAAALGAVADGDVEAENPFFAAPAANTPAAPNSAAAALGGAAVSVGAPGARASIDIGVRGRHGKKKTNVAAMAGFGITAVFLGIVMIFLLSSNSSRSNDRPVVQEEAPKPKPRIKEEATPYQLDRKKELEAEAKAALDATRSSKRYDPLIAKVKEEMQAIDGFWNEKRYYEGEKKFHDLESAIAAIAALNATRDGALSSKIQAQEIAARAKEKNAEQAAAKEWGEGGVHLAEAERLFSGEEFESANKAWSLSFQAYQKALVRSETAIAAAESRAKFLEDVVKNFTQAQIEAVGGPNFVKAVAAIGEGDKLYQTGEYDTALDKYQTANKLIPDIELAVQSVVGVHFWAVKTGYLATDAIIAVNKGQPFTKSMQADLRQAYNQLMVGPQFLAAIPTDEKPALDALAKLLLETARDTVVQNRGEVVRASYNIGVQVRIIEEILQSPGDYIETANKNAIKEKIEVIKSEAKIAGYSSEFLDVIGEMEEKTSMKPEFEALRQSRQFMHDLRTKLMEYDSAMEILPQGV